MHGQAVWSHKAQVGKDEGCKGDGSPIQLQQHKCKSRNVPSIDENLKWRFLLIQAMCVEFQAVSLNVAMQLLLYRCCDCHCCFIPDFPNVCKGPRYEPIPHDVLPCLEVRF